MVRMKGAEVQRYLGAQFIGYPFAQCGDFFNRVFRFRGGTTVIDGHVGAVARQTFGPYVTLPNYQNNLKWLGFEDSDFQDGGSDRLLDALFAWGDERAIRQRIQAHWDAGADHVCIQPIRPDGEQGPDHQLLELLAPANA